MKIDWCGSKTRTISAVEGQSLAFRVGSNLRSAKIFLSLWYVLVDQSSYLRIEQVTDWCLSIFLSNAQLWNRLPRLHRTPIITS